MPEINTNKYTNAKIYKITDTAYTECYIGSTIEPLCNRMASHRRKYKLWKNNEYHFVSSFTLFEKYGLDACKIELVEAYSCENKEELQKREGYHIQNTPCVNVRVAGRDKKQYYADNKTRILNKNKEYREKNIEKVHAREQQYRVENRDTICKKIRQHYANNKAKYSEKNKIYRKQNDKAIKARKAEKHQCTCGTFYSQSNKQRHMRTKLHQDYELQQKNKQIDI